MAIGDRYVAVGGDCHFGSFSVTRSGFVIGRGDLPRGFKTWEQVESAIWSSGLMGLRIVKMVSAADVVAAEREKMRAEIIREMEDEAKSKEEQSFAEGAGLVPIEPLVLPDAAAEVEEAEKQAQIRAEQDRIEAEETAARKQKNTEIREKRKAASEKKKAANAAKDSKAKK